MSAFVPLAPLHRRLTPHPRPCRTRRLTALSASSHEDSEPSAVSLDTLSGFESFCLRSQDCLCAATAAADGLGTFHALPATFPARRNFHPYTSTSTARPSSSSHTRTPPPRSRSRVMRGGRFFDSAVIAVWTSPSYQLPSARYRRRVTTLLDKRTETVEYTKEAVGVSVKLSPRDPVAPALRADAHYFQIGGGRVSWWFSGTADISMGPEADPEDFEESMQPFLETWGRVRERHRAPRGRVTRDFLDECFRAGAGAYGGVRGMDRVSAFAFITDVVDELLPAYLPLLSGQGKRRRSEGAGRIEAWEPVWGGGLRGGFGVESGFGDEEIDKFGISGGATCESVTVRGSPLGSWRFSLAPSVLTAAGKTYATLRNDHRSASGPLIHI